VVQRRCGRRGGVGGPAPAMGQVVLGEGHAVGVWGTVQGKKEGMAWRPEVAGWKGGRQSAVGGGMELPVLFYLNAYRQVASAGAL